LRGSVLTTRPPAQPEALSQRKGSVDEQVPKGVPQELPGFEHRFAKMDPPDLARRREFMRGVQQALKVALSTR
jgi:hypothetical protein